MRYGWLPPLIGVLGMAAAFNASGFTGAFWLAVGVFIGGFVPLYVMPWLRSRP